MQINRLVVKNYFALRDVSLEPGPLAVFIGPNGAGKTSLLDALMMLEACAGSGLEEAISSRGGMDMIITRGASDSVSLTRQFELRAEIKKPVGRVLSYDVQVRAKGNGYQISREVVTATGTARKKALTWIERSASSWTLKNDKGDEVSDKPDVDLSEAALAAVPAMSGFREVTAFREWLAATEFYFPIDVSADSAVLRPQKLDPLKYLPGGEGQYLVSALYNLKVHEGEAYERILDALRAGFPDFTSLDFPLTAAGRATFLWKTRNHREGLWPQQLSSGMLRFLWLATLLLSPRNEGIIILDEPEHSLHPTLLMILANLLREASAESQIFVATQSDRLIRWLEPEELFVMDLVDGLTQVRRGDDPALNVKEWLKEYTLDQLWLMGQLGGQP